MSVWICRAGKKGIYNEMFLKSQKIYIPWEGFDKDLETFDTFEALKQYVAVECNDTTDTAISTHSSQIRIFVSDMQIGDYVMVPANCSRQYSVGIIDSGYIFCRGSSLFHHSRNVRWIAHNISRSSFSDKMVHTLGAYRTIFGLKDDAEFYEYLRDHVSEGCDGVAG